MRLICLGDIAIRGPVHDATAWPRPLLNLVEQEQSYILFNWEFPCGEVCEPRPRPGGGPRRIASPKSVELLRGWAPAVAALANNHLMDAGAAGVAQTVAALHDVGISSFGGGVSSHGVSKPWIWETEEGRLGVLNWVTAETHPDSPDATGVGPNLWPGDKVAAIQIADLRRCVDWVVVYLHWSDERFSFPRPADRGMARRLIAFGADAIISCHPHVVRGVEEIDGRPVFYSLGNYFIGNVSSPAGGGPLRHPSREREALVVELRFRRGKPLAWRLHSYWRATLATYPDPQHRAGSRVARLSRPFRFSDYDAWYERKSRRFWRWGYRWHFRFPVLGWRGTLAWLFRAGQYP
jgi:hypothetical protein